MRGATARFLVGIAVALDPRVRGLFPRREDTEMQTTAVGGWRRTLALGIVAGAASVWVAAGGAGVHAAQAAAPQAKSGGVSAAPQAAIDVNSATDAQLASIPGIGPALARRIIEHREQNGPFRRVEDVLLVRGIGEKSFQKIQPYLKVEPRK